jgi:aspartate--ammonia ligase
MTMASKKMADLAGPGIGNYSDIEKILPNDYSSALTRRETQKGIFAVKRSIEDNLCKELNLMMVTGSLIVDRSRRPIQFHISNDRNKHPLNSGCGVA